MISEYIRYRKTPLLLVAISIAFYISFGYDLNRADFIKLIMLYGGLFFLFYKIIQTSKNDRIFLTGISILFRLIFLFSIPDLSQDFYRFIWDGNLILKGINPFIHTPDSLIASTEFTNSNAQILYDGMGSLSAGNFSNYPPLNQFLFALAALFSGKGLLIPVIVIRLLIILADLGTLYFGEKLLRSMQLQSGNIFWYILNPFIIIELSGNLHFEGIMLFFMIWSLYKFKQGRWRISALLMGLAIAIKLIPLIFLPFFYQQLKFKKWTIYCSIAIGLNLLLFLPFSSIRFFENYGQTLALWFLSFEFNGSIYYVLREIWLSVTGNKIINLYGHLSPIILMLFAIWLSLIRKNDSFRKLLINMMIFTAIYFFLATTVHPWYIATLLLISVFTEHRFPLLWSLLIFLSYSAYNHEGVQENFLLIAIEYVPVFGMFIYEVFLKPRERYMT